MAPSAELLGGRTALVTGASQGIGFAIARRLAAAGVRVAMVARTQAALDRAASDVGGVALPADVSLESEAARLPGRFQSAMGSQAPDFLVNAAGAFGLAPIAETSVEQFDRSVSVNLRGPFLMIRGFLPAMIERGTGYIVTIGSVAGRHAFPANGAYSAAKFGVRGLHAVLSLELKGTGVRSTLVEPAATDTALWDTVDRAANQGLPARSAMLEPEAVADAVLYAVTRPAETAIGVIALERA